MARLVKRLGHEIEKQTTTAFQMPAARVPAKEFVDQHLPALVKRITGGKIGTVELPTELDAAVRGAWLVVEAVPEKLELKKQIFAELDQFADADAILASNSSSYATADFMDKVVHRDRVLNMHFYMPPDPDGIDLMSSGSTRPELIELLKKVLPAYGVYPFVARKRSTGFIFNRIWAAIKRESLMVVATGVADPTDVDQMMKLNLGTTYGPFELMDMVGLDVVLDIEKHYIAENPRLPTDTIELLRRYVDTNRLGRKTGQGFYDHTGATPQALPVLRA
jgi:3-hydroxybutyryl-CoA dehydrogenase